MAAAARCRELLNMEGARRAALAPLGDLCRSMPAIAAGIVSVQDDSWGGTEQYVNEKSRLPSHVLLNNPWAQVLKLLSDQDDIDVSTCGSGCVVVLACLNVITVAALALLLFDLGATSFLYSRKSRTKPFGAACGQFRDWRDAVDQFFVQIRARHTLENLVAAAVGDSSCPMRPVPTLAMDLELSDKGSNGHFYTRVYDHVLHSRRCGVNDLLEVGIGSVDYYTPSTMAREAAASRGYRPGASLRAWLDVFPRANITGLDIDARVLSMPYWPRRPRVPGRRLRTYLVNTLNQTRAQEVLQQKEFDVIVDDGYHLPHAQRATFRALWPHLRPGGLYIIEDMEAAGAHQFAAEMGGVAVGTGSWSWLTLVHKHAAETPLFPVRLPHIPRHYNTCWVVPSLGTAALHGQHGAKWNRWMKRWVRRRAWHCCGGDGQFPDWWECGFMIADIRSECCFSYFVREGLIA